MRLSINMIVQILGIAGQALNQMIDLFPSAESKGTVAAIIGVIQAFTALLAHFRNPDGTNAKTAYVSPAKKLEMRSIFFLPLFLPLFLFMPLRAYAETTQGVTLGAAWNQNASPALQGWGTYDRIITGRLFTYSGYDVTPIHQEGKLIPQLKFSAFTGLAVQAAVIGRITLFVQGAGGLATTAEVTTGSGNFGGFAHIGIGKGCGLILGGQGTYSPISGTDAVLRFGFRYGK